VNAQDWLARFAIEDARRVAEQVQIRAEIAAKVNRIQVANVNPIQVLEPGRGLDSHIGAVAKAVLAARTNGWTTRVVESLAADPRKGIIEIVTLRARRHDERCWAAWWSGAYQGGWYWSREAQVEALGWERLGDRVARMLKAAQAGKPVPEALRVRSILDVFDGIQLTRH
jgi:hypothetical protein